MKKPLSWLPWRVDSWLYGSSRHELTRAQRSDFLDLALFSAKDDGWIRANETMPYPISQLAGMLCVQPEELEETIERCIAVGKITRHRNGILRITNYETYKLTDRWRRELDKKPLSPSPSSKNKSKKRRGEESKGKRNTPPKKRKGVPKKRNSPPTSPRKIELIEEEIPKGLAFKDGDELRELKREHNDLIRLAGNEEEMGRRGRNRADVLAKAARVRERFEQVKADTK